VLSFNKLTQFIENCSVFQFYMNVKRNSTTIWCVSKNTIQKRHTLFIYFD